MPASRHAIAPSTILQGHRNSHSGRTEPKESGHAALNRCDIDRRFPPSRQGQCKSSFPASSTPSSAHAVTVPSRGYATRRSRSRKRTAACASSCSDVGYSPAPDLVTTKRDRRPLSSSADPATSCANLWGAATGTTGLPDQTPAALPCVAVTPPTKRAEAPQMAARSSGIRPRGKRQCPLVIRRRGIHVRPRSLVHRRGPRVTNEHAQTARY